MSSEKQSSTDCPQIVPVSLEPMPTGTSQDITISLANAVFSKVTEFLGRAKRFSWAHQVILCPHVPRSPRARLRDASEEVPSFVPAWSDLPFPPEVSLWHSCTSRGRSRKVTTQVAVGLKSKKQRENAACIQKLSRDPLQLMSDLSRYVHNMWIYAHCKISTRTKCLGEIKFTRSWWIFFPPSILRACRCWCSQGADKAMRKVVSEALLLEKKHCWKWKLMWRLSKVQIYGQSLLCSPSSVLEFITEIGVVF